MFLKKKKENETASAETKQDSEERNLSPFYQEIVRIARDNQYKGITKETIADFENKLREVIRAEAERGGRFINSARTPATLVVG